MLLIGDERVGRLGFSFGGGEEGEGEGGKEESWLSLLASRELRGWKEGAQKSPCLLPVPPLTDFSSRFVG